MNDELTKKAERVFYHLTKNANAARSSWNDFLYEECDCSDSEWQEVKKEITEKTGIEFKYL